MKSVRGRRCRRSRRSNDFPVALQAQAGLVDFRRAEIVRERGDIRLHELLQVRGCLAGRRRGRAVHDGIGVLGEDLVVVVVGVIEEEVVSGKSVLTLNRRIVDLRNAGVEEAVAGAHHQRVIVSNGIRQANARRKVIRPRKGPCRNPARAGWRPSAWWRKFAGRKRRA